MHGRPTESGRLIERFSGDVGEELVALALTFGERCALEVRDEARHFRQEFREVEEQTLALNEREPPRQLRLGAAQHELPGRRAHPPAPRHPPPLEGCHGLDRSQVIESEQRLPLYRLIGQHC